jgi:hypothetical protein
MRNINDTRPRTLTPESLMPYKGSQSNTNLDPTRLENSRKITEQMLKRIRENMREEAEIQKEHGLD